ncbi:glycoside hydrolase family 19 protein [Paraburkholderia sp. UCT31]|uniref:glycoside hydrolase family 19 protein n=1 Tax=Paraburkholderia sp. UCT31 TaxID=2615209 RepID=UPI00223AC004|nr:glycoside hydrolase family 19 protein [Paraburkholderia sp. UCT31]
MATTTPPPNPPITPVKLLQFAFPFRRKGTGGAPADFIDEHEFHKLLRQEPSGAYSVSGKGMWHGGIHVTEAGAGASLDLKGGVRCIANGEVVAWRLDSTYPVSEIPARNGQPAISAPYSTGFALVRHSMEFPKDRKLTFYSLYAHLQDFADYESDAHLPRPKYWATRFEVTTCAQDRPTAGSGGQLAPAGQQGLRVRVSRPHGAVLCILPQGAQVSLGRREDGWGQIKDASGVSPYPGTAGGVAHPATNGWIFLGAEHGGPVVREVMPDSSLDRVIVLSTPSEVVPIKAGELIGHLGRYDPLSRQTSGNRMVHIEVFCDDSIKSFIDEGRSWIGQNGAKVNAWKQLALPGEPTIQRIDSGTTLYTRHNEEGAEAGQTGVIEVFPLAALARGSTDRQYIETETGGDGDKWRWWKIDSADVRHQPIDGWVREENFAGGRVTREFAQKWVDFQTLDDEHDPTHTMFATTNGFVDYAMGADVPDAGSLGKLSALMSSIYQALNLGGDPARAADGLRNAANDPWTALRMSRLIIQHESEWANPDKWKQLIAAIEQRTGPKAEHVEEQKRIGKLVWWDVVKAGLTDFPGSNVFHIHPVGLVGNFRKLDSCDCGCCLINGCKVTRWNGQTVHYGPIYKGNLSLENSPAMRRFLDTGRMTEQEHRILVAMSQNEGNVDGVQAYDSEIFTAGACQKTVNPTGAGEFTTQVAQFKAENEAAYQRLFAQCGWTIEEDSGLKMYYQDSEITGGVKITGDELYKKLREGCTQATFGHSIKQKPLAAIAHAIRDDEFQDKQVKDFVARLRLVRTLTPVGYAHSLAEYFLTDLGHATALDEHVNRPSNVVKDTGKALDVFFHANPTVKKDPSTWGDSHAAYELEILAYYGEHRNMNDCRPRFAQLRGKLS